MTGKFQAGDVHPVHNLLAFVEYDESGREWWTSIATDPMAPFRLASVSKPNHACHNHAGSRNSHRLRDADSQNQRLR
jgi:hypothetical protein